MSEDFSFGPSQADVDAMQEELAQRRLADWQREAVTAHPNAAPFADLLVGGSKEAVLELAAEIANRRAPGGHRTGPATAANSGERQPTPDSPAAPSSAEVLEGFRSGKFHKRDPEAARQFFTARLSEAADGAA